MVSNARNLLLVTLLGFAACSDGGSVPADPQLVTKGSFTLMGQLTSGLLVAVDQNQALFTIDPSGGTVTQIVAKADGGARVSGNVVFVSHDINASNLGGLGTWTEATGYHDLGATNASVVSAFTDGTNVAYAENVDGTTFAADMVVDTIDHAGAKTLFTQQVYSLLPIIYGGKIILGHAPSTSPSLTGTITSYDLGTGIGTDLLTSALIYYVNNTQKTAFVASGSAGGNTLFDLAAGTMITLPAEVLGATFSADGKSLYATTNTGGFEVITWSGSTASAQAPLLTSDVSNVFSGSANDKYVLYNSNFDDTTESFDLKLLELSAPSMGKTLASDGIIFGAFSPDSSFVTFNVDVNQSTLIGTLMFAPVSTGVPVQLSNVAYTSAYVGSHQMLVLEVSAAKPSVGDLELFDLTKPSTPTPLASQIDTDYLLSNDGKTVYYTNSSALTPVGIYKQPLS
jgi:hypothetical protein